MYIIYIYIYIYIHFHLDYHLIRYTKSLTQQLTQPFGPGSLRLNGSAKSSDLIMLAREMKRFQAIWEAKDLGSWISMEQTMVYIWVWVKT